GAEEAARRRPGRPRRGLPRPCPPPVGPQARAIALPSVPATTAARTSVISMNDPFGSQGGRAKRRVFIPIAPRTRGRGCRRTPASPRDAYALIPEGAAEAVLQVLLGRSCVQSCANALLGWGWPLRGAVSWGARRVRQSPAAISRSFAGLPASGCVPRPAATRRGRRAQCGRRERKR